MIGFGFLEFHGLGLLVFWVFEFQVVGLFGFCVLEISGSRVVLFWRFEFQLIVFLGFGCLEFQEVVLLG